MKKLALALLLTGGLNAQEIPVAGGFTLPARFDLPAQAPVAVVVLLHGSGQHSMDEDLSAVTKGEVANPFFARLSAALTRQGLAVLRYDKRNYALKNATPGPARDAAAQEMLATPLSAFVADATSAVQVARTRFPGLPVLLVGHSEGTTVALHTARLDPSIAGLGLISWSGVPLEALVYEQFAHRHWAWFHGFDRDKDGSLNAVELQAVPLLQKQLAVLDLDRNQAVSYSEFQGGNVSNVVLHPLIPDVWRREEASVPTPMQCVREAPQRLAFFQGEWDNQTPAYYVRAVEIAEQQVWKKGNKRFTYFARLGHALDRRDSWEETTFQVPAEATLDAVAQGIARFLVRGE